MLTETIRSAYPGFSRGKRRIADYLIDHYEEAAFLTAMRLGECAGVSESTVVRFAYDLGLDGYPALQRELRELLRSRLNSVQRIRLASDIPEQELLQKALGADMENLRVTMEQMNAQAFSDAVTLLLNARTVYVLGMRSAAVLARYFCGYLDYVCERVSLADGNGYELGEQLMHAGAEDLCFVISFPRYSARTTAALRGVRARGARIVALTDREDSPVAQMADVRLCASCDMTSFADSLTAPLSVLSALLAAVAHRKGGAVSERLTQLETLWLSDGVYLDEKGKA